MCHFLFLLFDKDKNKIYIIASVKTTFLIGKNLLKTFCIEKLSWDIGLVLFLTQTRFIDAFQDEIASPPRGVSQ